MVKRSESLHTISGLQKFPVELLAHIFEDVIEADCSGFCKFSKFAAVWALSQTCRKWREVAITTPTLWNVILTDTFLYKEFHASGVIQALRLFLERSRPLPVSWHIVFGEDSGAPEKSFEGNAEIFSLLLSHSSRWRHVQIDSFDGGHIVKRLCETKELTSLHSLVVTGSIHRNHHLSPSDPVVKAGVLAIARNLVEASLLCGFDGYGFDLVPSPKLCLPWTRLKELTFTAEALQDFLAIAASLTSVEYLRIVCYFHSTASTATTSRPQLVLPKVHSLDLSEEYESILEVMAHLTLPKLEDLRIQPDASSAISSREMTELLPSIVRLQERSVSVGGTGIRVLRVIARTFSARQAPELSRVLGEVEELHLFHFDNEGECIDDTKVLKNFKKKNMFPRLRSLHILLPYANPRNFTFLPVLIDVVKARRPPLRAGARTRSNIGPTLAYIEQLSLNIESSSAPTYIRVVKSTALFEKLLRYADRGLDLCGGHLEKGRWVSDYRDTHWSEMKEKRRIQRFRLGPYIEKGTDEVRDEDVEL
ncbi:hypothetical protein Moror_11397 [Moniliophthora roreri MCA 2997]|uniref:Uncharacterized protein n=1 Tax=Moniliophthora roreri (strain MCA 2997) TaxID=1381753 RepID=V2Y0P7_MONRO|nr:hypothetical protein Moror_11397 [Moniliophthora roreri MCA 2997]